MRRSSDLLRDVEPDDHRRVARRVRPEPVGVGRERRPGLCELERTHDAAAVVRVHGGGRSRIELRQALVRRVRVLVVEPRPALARARLRRRRQLELRERGPQVEARPADDDRRLALGEDLVDRGVCQRRVGTDRRFLVERPDRDEPRRAISTDS